MPILKIPIRSRKTLLSALVILFFMAAVCIVFWCHISGSAVFIGESDRLNSYLNIRLAEYDALRDYGYVPAWNPSMFGGFSMAGLHWMNPGKDPVPYLLQFIPREDVFQALGYLSIFLVFASCVTAFFYIRDVTQDIASGATGALAYGLSVFSLHRAAQVDNAHLTVVLIPLALLALRRVRSDNLVAPFAGLTAIMTSLAFWGFLQEVAYAFIFFGCYALYRAAVQTKSGFWCGLAPVMVMALASFLALLFAMSRLLTLANDFSFLERASTLRNDNYAQVLRFFHEGIYGRYFEEGRLLGNGMNLHEGLQLVSSAALSLFVCVGIARPRSRAETIAGMVFFSLFAAILPTCEPLYALVNERLPMSPELFKVLAYGALGIGVMVAARKYWSFRFMSAGPRPLDTTFHLFALSVILFLVLIPEANNAIYLLFGRIDFTHTRLSVLLILPLCTLFSIYLAELKHGSAQEAAPKGVKRYAIPVVVVGLAGITAYLVQSSFLERWIPRDAFKLLVLDQNGLMPTVAVSVIAIAVLLAALMTATTILRKRRPSIGRLAGFALIAFVVVEIVGYASLKMAGPQTWTYPVPFRAFNYLNVDLPVLRPPEDSERRQLQKELETERYRSVVLNDRGGYPETNISHLAQFWEFRTIGGYATGVPERLARLPWPKDVQTLRTIDFTSIQNLNASIFPLLAFLNVKYLLMLTPDVYFNVPSKNFTKQDERKIVSIGDRDYALKNAEIGGVVFSYIENPVKPLPRHFLVEQVVGSRLPPQPLDRPTDDASSVRVFEDQSDDLTHTSFVERNFIGETKTFDASGELSVSYRGDVIDVRVTPSAQERFLVLAESYNPQWHVYAGGVQTATIPTNIVMNGVLIPPGLDRVQLRFEPFSSQRLGLLMTLAALCGFVAFIVLLSWVQRRRILER